jgi:hypothetical protein
MAPFGCADKQAEKHCWLIYCKRKILFQLKKEAEKRRIISRMNMTYHKNLDLSLFPSKFQVFSFSLSHQFLDACMEH